MRGRLYDLPYGFPALVVAEEDVLASGTTDYRADAEALHHLHTRSAQMSIDPVVHGEMFVFDDPEERLPALDGLEGYVPGEEGLYERVLIPVKAKVENTVAWAYRIRRAAGVYLPGGRWPAP